MPEPIDDDRIRPALHAFLAGDATALEAAVDADPAVIDLAWNGNTLLEWATQPPHDIDPAVIEVLLERGARIDRALNLAACWNLPELCARLLAAGADPRARADAGITPLESAAMHGSTEAADVLARHGLHRPSLWLAAAAGHLDLVREWVFPTLVLADGPGPHRPDWSAVGRAAGPAPGDDPAEIIGEAFVMAAANGRTAIVDHLLAAGADIDARPYRNTTGLHLAIQFAKPHMVARLLELGASTDIRDDEHRSDARGWARACNDGSPQRAEIVELLAAGRAG